MPFNPKAIKKLRKSENLSQNDLSNLLKDYAKLNGLKNKKFSKGLISKWENDHQGPDWDNLDLLYMVARDYGHKYLKFYITPTNYKSMKLISK